MSEQYLLCRPRGGLNDTLNQIEKCWQYCFKFNRTLIIDSTFSALNPNFLIFFNFIDYSVKVIFELVNFKDNLNNLTCYPKFLNKNINEYTAEYCIEKFNFVESTSKKVLSFDFNSIYTEDLLIHEQCGGGNLSFSFLERITLSKQLKSILIYQIHKLPIEYHAVHIRNTDYKTKEALQKSS